MLGVGQPLSGGGASGGGASGGGASGAGPTASAGQPGTFTAFTKPFARVFIDGKDTGKMTPISPRSAISLSPGPHKVTFVVGDQRHEFRVVIESGKNKNLVKVLPGS